MNRLRPALSVDEWIRLNRLLEQGLDLDRDARAAWLAGLASETPRIRDTLQSLLAQSEAGAAPDDGGPPSALARVASDALAAMHPDWPGQMIGPWRLERLLAEGGMGAVWRAERADGVMERTAALKLPRSEWIDRGLSERIARERAFLARLQHPNIAVLYDAGVTAEGRPYLALEYVEGQPIDAYCRERRLELRDLLRLFLPIVRAVSYAHSRLIIHRDIKPGNILVTPDSVPKLLDFGVSKLIEGEKSAAEVTILTQVAGRPLTLAYAAPEQLRAQHVTVAIDVYALGVVLFELVTGTRLYRATMPYALEQEILAGDIRRPSDAASDPRRARELRGDLDAIIFTALRNQPDQRYASAAAFADDLERHLAGEPVQARLDSRSYRLLRFITRNRLPVAAAGAIALAIGIGAGVALWQATIAREQAREATALNTFVLSLIKHADPMASQQTKRADLATLTAIEERIDREFQGTPTQLLRLRLTIGDAYRNRGEMTAAQRAYQHAIDAAAGVVPEDDLLLLAAHVRRADWRLIASADAADRLGRVIEVLRSKGAIGADLLIDALLIRHQLSKEFGVPTFPPSAHLFNAVGEALDVADRHFGVGSRQYLKAALPYAFLVDDSGDRPNAQRLIDESLREARQRADDVASSMEYHDVLTAHYTYLCATPRASEGLAGLWGALEQVRASHDDTSVRLEAHYSALGLCYERIADPTGYWLYAAAFDVAAARERPPSMPLMRRATIAMTWAIFVHDYAAAERYFLSAMENIAAISEPLLRERLSRNILMDRVCLLSYRGDSDDAERVAAPLLRALDNEPGSAPSRAEVRMRKCLSFAQRDNGRFDDAARTAQDLIERCRAHTEASHVPCRNRGMLALGRALLDAGRYDEALAIFDKRRKLPLRTEINPESALGAARALLALGHTAEATEWLQQVYGFWLSSPTPRSVYASEAEYWLGQAYLAGGDRRGHWMVAEARQALAASPLKLHRALAAQGTTASPPEVALRRQ